MKLLIEVILFAIPMVVLAWTLPTKVCIAFADRDHRICSLHINHHSLLNSEYNHIWKLLSSAQSCFTKVHKSSDQPMYFNIADRVSKNFVYHT